MAQPTVLHSVTRARKKSALDWVMRRAQLTSTVVASDMHLASLRLIQFRWASRKIVFFAKM